MNPYLKKLVMNFDWKDLKHKKEKYLLNELFKDINEYPNPIGPILQD